MNLETNNESIHLGLVHRAIAFGMAVATTAFIATSVAVVFTGSTQTFGAALFQAAATPLRAMLGN